MSSDKLLEKGQVLLASRPFLWKGNVISGKVWLVIVKAYELFLFKNKGATEDTEMPRVEDLGISREQWLFMEEDKCVICQDSLLHKERAALTLPPDHNPDGSCKIKIHARCILDYLKSKGLVFFDAKETGDIGNVLIDSSRGDAYFKCPYCKRDVKFFDAREGRPCEWVLPVIKSK